MLIKARGTVRDADVQSRKRINPCSPLVSYTDIPSPSRKEFRSLRMTAAMDTGIKPDPYICAVPLQRPRASFQRSEKGAGPVPMAAGSNSQQPRHSSELVQSTQLGPTQYAP